MALEQIIDVMTPDELANIDWYELSEDSRISLDFISRTFDKHPWILINILSTRPGIIDFVRRHRSAIFSPGNIQDTPNCLRVLSVVHEDDLPELMEILDLSWEDIRNNVHILNDLCRNPTIGVDLIRRIVDVMRPIEWRSISRYNQNISELFRLFPDKVQISELVTNNNLSDEIIRALPAPGNVINCAGLSIDCIKDIMMHKLINVDNRPDITPELIEYCARDNSHVYSNAVIRNLDVLPKLSDLIMEGFSGNPNLTPEFVFVNLDLDWFQPSLVSVMPMDIIELTEWNPEHVGIFDLKYLGDHPEITLDIFLRYRHKIELMPLMW